MSGMTEKILSKLEKINRTNEELVTLLIDNPTCLDAYQYRAFKKQIYQYAVAYFEAKNIESQSQGYRTPNSRTSILLRIAVEDWQVCRGDAERKAAAKITKILLETDVQELKFVPEDIRASAFKIIRSYLAELFENHS